LTALTAVAQPTGGPRGPAPPKRHQNLTHNPNRRAVLSTSKC